MEDINKDSKQNKKNQPTWSKEIKHILVGLASLLIWGLGQVFNRQYIKGLFFFVFFVGLLFTEYATGKYNQVIDPYRYLPGTDYSDIFATNFYTRIYQKEFTSEDYSYELPDYIPEEERFVDFGQYIEENGQGVVSMDLLTKFIAKDLVDHNPVRMYSLIEESTAIVKNQLRSSDLYYDNPEDTAAITALNENKVILSQQLYHNEDYSALYQKKDALTSEYVNIKDPSDIIIYLSTENNTITAYDKDDLSKTPIVFPQYKLTGDLYLDSLKANIYLRILDGSTTYYTDIFNDPYDHTLLTASVLGVGPTTKPITLQTRSVYLDRNAHVVYELFDPETTVQSLYVGYHTTEFSSLFAEYLGGLYSTAGYSYKETDMQRFLIKVYFEMHPDLKQQFEIDFSNFFYEQAGIFVKGFWGVITLGEHSPWSINEYQTIVDALDTTGVSTYLPSLEIRGHISTLVLLDGLIGVLLLVYFIIFMIWGVIDAYMVSKKLELASEKDKNDLLKSTKEYFKTVYEEGFEYIVLSPAIFVITFISIMPILFGFLIAFTSISGNKSLTENFSWVGFNNFIYLFDFTNGLGEQFGVAFWNVLLWTTIWAFFSTFTVFFGGFFQAVILNSEHVPFKKFWRTILILPWAIPGLLSQMVFSVMFNEYGFINELLRSIGLYDRLFELGWLGKTAAEAQQLIGLDKLLYLGSDNIQWFSNPVNPTFVRVTLIVVNIWLGFPYFMALMSGVMTSIDKTLYEAARIDGADKNQLFKFITFPLVMYSTAPILIMTFSGNFNNFGVIYFITGGGPNAGEAFRGYAGDTDILISWMYKLTVNYSIYNMASVFSVLIFIFVGSVTAWNLTRTRAFKED